MSRYRCSSGISPPATPMRSTETLCLQVAHRVDRATRPGHLREGEPFRVVEVKDLEPVYAEAVDALTEGLAHPIAVENTQPALRVSLGRDDDILRARTHLTQRGTDPPLALAVAVFVGGVQERT